MKNWILVRPKADCTEASKELNIDPVCVRIMNNRGLDTVQKMRRFLETDISDCDNFDGMPNMEQASNCIEEALQNKVKTRIIGDYDADGVCATVILVKGLRILGLDVDFAIPNRMLDGYGLNRSIVDKAYEDNIGLIVTCDNGISARDAVDYASELGMKTVVTDHHTVTESEMPTKADALVNPKMPQSSYANEDICGALVAYKLLSYVLKKEDFSRIKDELLEFVAIATVTDVMPLIKENRDVVRWGLQRIDNPVNSGLKTLVRSLGINKNDKQHGTSVFGFAIGPCINATGRIDIADRAVNLFLSENEEERRSIAEELIKINEERKILTKECVEKGISIIENNSELLKDAIVVLYIPECHVSICGLVAGKIKDKYYRPTFVFTDSKEGLTGSGRSVDEFDMIDGVVACKELLTKFGGHKKACGLSMKKENLLLFREKINKEAGVTVDSLIETIRIDANMPFGYVTERLTEDLNRLEPFGKENETPVFALKDLVIVNARRVGETGMHLFLYIRDNKGTIRMLKLWREADNFDAFLLNNTSKDIVERMYTDEGIEKDNVKITVSYFPSINEFNGKRRVEYKMIDYKMS